MAAAHDQRERGVRGQAEQSEEFLSTLRSARSYRGGECKWVLQRLGLLGQIWISPTEGRRTWAPTPSPAICMHLSEAPLSAQPAVPSIPQLLSDFLRAAFRSARQTLRMPLIQSTSIRHLLCASCSIFIVMLSSPNNPTIKV